MGLNDTTRTDKEGKVWDIASIFNQGAQALIGRTMKTSNGPRVIARIWPDKYKACTVLFTDGTEQRRDFDETFQLAPMTDELDLRERRKGGSTR